MRSKMEDYDYEAYRQRVRTLVELTENGNMSAFARKSGISSGTIRNWMVHGWLPNADTLVKIARAYNVNINWLLLGRTGKVGSNEREPKTSDK